MPRISTSGVQAVDTSRIDQAEAFRRQEALRREQLQQQAIAQQLQAQLAREGLDVQREGLGLQRDLGMADIGARRDMPGLSADAALRQQGGTGMDLMQAQMGGQERLAHIGNLPAMEQLRMEQTMRALQMSQELEHAYRTGAIDAGTYQMMRDRILGGDQPQAAQQTVPAEPQRGQPQSVHLGGFIPRSDPGVASSPPPPAAVTPAPTAIAPDPLTEQDVGQSLRQAGLGALQNVADSGFAGDRLGAIENAAAVIDIGRRLSAGPGLTEMQAASMNSMVEAVSEFSQINDKTSRSTMDFMAEIAHMADRGEMTAQQQLAAVRQLYDRMKRVAELRAEVLSIVADNPERIAQSGANIDSVMDLDLADENAFQRLRSMRDAMRVDQDERLQQTRHREVTDAVNELLERRRERRDTVQRSYRDSQAPQTGAWPGVDEGFGGQSADQQALQAAIEAGLLQQYRSAQGRMAQ